MKPDRKTRGAILFVGSFNEELISGIEQPVRCVYTVFDAVGELASCSASDLVEAVVIDEKLISHNPTTTIDAMRRIDPNTVIVVAGETGNQEHADAVIPIDSTANRLTSTIANVTSQPYTTDLLHEIDLDLALGISEEKIDTDETSPLGDVDLVRSLMHNPATFNSVLINMLKQQTGWEYCAIVDDASSVSEDSQVAPLRYGRDEHGSLVAIGATAKDLARWARWTSCWLELSRRQRKYKLLAYQDDLSGAWNRRFLRTCLTREMQIVRNERRPLTVMIFDIDDFKHYNDRWGHDAGDEIIREIVKLLCIIIRRGDYVCRIGGDEFAVLFCDPEPPRELGSNHPTTVEILARRFQEQVARAHFPKLGNEATGILTISGGLATYPWDGNDVDSILKKADDRLLQSKRQGKNSITIGRKFR